MFGPNANTRYKGVIDYHHRENKFIDLYIKTVRLFKERFNISDDYLVALITGSGTLAIETVLFSIEHKFNIVGKSGKFKDRLIFLSKRYNKYDNVSNGLSYCGLETSISGINEYKEPFFVDCVSSFPYYKVPPKTKVWVTVTSKILGSIPVLGIIVISKTLLRNLIDENDFSYLNLKRILNASYSGQTHHTPAIPQILDFYEKLKNFDTDKMKDNINANCEILLDAIGEDNVIGEKYCPVITIKKEYLPKVISEKYQLYGHWSKGYVQIFTYSEQRKDYESLAYDIKKAR